VGGASVVQFRHKSDDARLRQGAIAVRQVCAAFSVTCIVNDSAALADDIDADGLHLGQSDLAQAAEWRGREGRLLGVSVSTPEQARRAVAMGADYLGVGPVFPTGSKADADPAIGLDGLRVIREAAGIPIAAIGGISEHNAAEVMGAGADAICVISAVSLAPDPLTAARRLVDIADTTRRMVR
jgi:thiamine-phosphate pyrophosphorylase